jgi:hypothetical protein
MILTHLNKEHQDIPDAYGVTIHWVSGGKDDFEIASHRVVDSIVLFGQKGGLTDLKGKTFDFAPNPCPYFEFFTSEDVLQFVPMTSVKRIEFDKRHAKIREIKAKLDREKNQDQSKGESNGDQKL